MEKKNYIVAVDLGSHAVVVAVAAKQEDGNLEIVSLVSKPIKGVTIGRIGNIELVSQALGEAIEEAGQQAGIRIVEAYAGISGEFVRCARHTDFVYVSDYQNGVVQSDVHSLFARMNNLQAPEDEQIMERIPQRYMIDDQHEVADPVGEFGQKLSATFNFILCQKTPIQRLDMALKRVGVKKLGVIPNTLATALAVLSADEKEDGVAVVNLGADVTDVTICHRGIVRYIGSIPIGSSAIDRDIRSMGVQERFITQLKHRYGSAVAANVPEEKVIRVQGMPPRREARDILLRNLATVIEARAQDIVDLVRDELRYSGYADNLGYGLVLTGGSANLTDIDELFRRSLNMEVRVAVPDISLTEESCAKVNDPQYATVVGLLMQGAERSVNGVGYAELPPEKRVVEPQQPVKPTQPTPPTPPRREPVQPVKPEPKPVVEPSKPTEEPVKPQGGTTKEYVAPVVPISEQTQPEEKPVQPVQPVQPAVLPVEDDGGDIDDTEWDDEPKKEPWWKRALRQATKAFESPDDDVI